MKNSIKLFVIALLVSTGFAQASGGGGNYDTVNVDRQNFASMQHGAKLYINYCLGCHTLKYQRYGRMAKDLHLPEAMVIQNMIFNGGKIGSLMTNNMPAEDAEKWFGTSPPDLSLIVRSRGADFLYTYLRGFYKDESRPYGVNNIAFDDVGMPHALETLQGLQLKSVEANAQEDIIFDAKNVLNSAEARLGREGEDDAALENEIDEANHAIHQASIDVLHLRAENKYFVLATKGLLTAEEYDVAVNDIVNFLDYVAEPIKTKRQSMGVWVILFLIILYIPAHLLKKEYWKDVD